MLLQSLIRTVRCHRWFSTGDSFSPSPAVNLLESALPRNERVTPVESALPKSLDLKSFRIRTYKKGGGEGTNLLTKDEERTNQDPRKVMGAALDDAGAGKKPWTTR